MLKELSIFLLAYNEEQNIRKCVESALKNAKKVAAKYEVIVVLYEGSTDSTRDIVRGLMKKHSNLRLVIQKKKNKGYGAGLKKGFESSKYKYIFYTDADNQFNLNEISKLLPYLKEYDIVSGYRRKRSDPFMRIVYAKVYNILIGMMFWKWFKDVDSAFKIYKKDIFDKMKIKKNSGAADAEILVKARKKGYKIKEVPVSHHYRPKGKTRFEYGWGVIKFNVVLELIKDLFSLWREIHFK
jgi:glycosyltransferase involved in cell wall biosynthesis